MIYLIGSLRNPEVPSLAAFLRSGLDIEVFTSWFCASPIADDSWQKHEQERGLTFAEALKDYAAQHVYNFDLTHISRANVGVLVLPAGKSGHLELGYMAGKGKRTYILLEKEPERWDVMYNFATAVVSSKEELLEKLKEDYGREKSRSSNWSETRT